MKSIFLIMGMLLLFSVVVIASDKEKEPGWEIVAGDKEDTTIPLSQVEPTEVISHSVASETHDLRQLEKIIRENVQLTIVPVIFLEYYRNQSYLETGLLGAGMLAVHSYFQQSENLAMRWYPDIYMISNLALPLKYLESTFYGCLSSPPKNLDYILDTNKYLIWTFIGIGLIKVGWEFLEYYRS